MMNEDIIKMEKVLAVIAIESVNWFSPFYIHGIVREDGLERVVETVVRTIDRYTWQCEKCHNIERCVHTKAVHDYVLANIEEQNPASNGKKNFLIP